MSQQNSDQMDTLRGYDDTGRALAEPQSTTSPLPEDTGSIISPGIQSVNTPVKVSDLNLVKDIIDSLHGGPGNFKIVENFSPAGLITINSFVENLNNIVEKISSEININFKIDRGQRGGVGGLPPQ